MEDLDRQEFEIKIEKSLRQAVLTPVIRDEASLSNSQAVQINNIHIEILDSDDEGDGDILEINTEYSVLGPETICISDDENNVDVSTPMPRSNLKASKNSRKTAAMRSKVINKLFKNASSPMSSARKNPTPISFKGKSKNISFGNTHVKKTNKTPLNNTNMPTEPKRESSPSAAPSPTPTPLPRSTSPNAATSESKQSNQQNFNPLQNINKFKNQLKMTVVDKGHQHGKIDPCYEEFVVNAISERMLEQMNSNHYISPRFVNSYWRKGKCVFICEDMATRQFLIESVAQLGELWPGCALAAVHFNASSITKRVRLILGGRVLSQCVNFMATLARQNPELNVYEWEMVKHSPWRYDNDSLLEFDIDPESYAQLRRQGGYVHFGFGRLLFNLELHRPMNRLTPLIKRMIRSNINGIFNVQSGIRSKSRIY